MRGAKRRSNLVQSPPSETQKTPSVTEKIPSVTRQLLTCRPAAHILYLSTGTEVPGTGYGVDVKKILLVCADLAVTAELTFFLQHSGFQVTSAKESRQVLDEMDIDTPDLVVMRENSRRLNGDELCIRIRELSDVPIIVLGQGWDEAAGVEMLEMGADAYLTAPLNPNELLARVRALLRRTRAPEANMKENSQVWK